MKTIFFLFFIASSQFAFNQNSTTDAVQTLKAKNIKPSTIKYIQYTEKKDGTIDFQSLLTREVKNTQYNGNDVYLITQKYQSQKSVDIDSSFVNANNLRPISYHSDIRSEGHKEIVEFSNNEISNSITFKDSVKAFAKPNLGSFNGVIMDDLIGELPLQKGKIFTIKSVNPGLRFFEYTTKITVLGIENLKINNITTIKCWKVKVSTSSNNKGSTKWYSIKDHLQVKSVYEFANGNKFIRSIIFD